MTREPAHVEFFDVELGAQDAVELHLHARRRVDRRVVARPRERELALQLKTDTR